MLLILKSTYIISLNCMHGSAAVYKYICIGYCHHGYNYIQLNLSSRIALLLAQPVSLVVAARPWYYIRTYCRCVCVYICKDKWPLYGP